jgi:hypothetical protein
MARRRRPTSRPTAPSTAINEVEVIPTAAIANAPKSHSSTLCWIGIPSWLAIAQYPPDVSNASTTMNAHLISSVRNREILTCSANR